MGRIEKRIRRNGRKAAQPGRGGERGRSLPRRSPASLGERGRSLPRRSPASLGERGSIPILIVLLLSFLAFIPVAMQLVRVSHRETRRQLNETAQADNVARAGLTDAVGWFRRQSVQPVRSSVDPVEYPYPDAAFRPLASTDTLVSDTDEESVGLVREYRLGESSWLWARYEVKRQTDPAAGPWDERAVHDISDKRVDGASSGDGLAWSIVSTGYVYRCKDASVPFDQAPNEIVAKARMSTEIRRLALTLPVNAAIITTSRQHCTINADGKVYGQNHVGVAYYTGAAGPHVTGSGVLDGTPPSFDIDGAANGALTMPTIFGVSKGELNLMSDYSVTSADDLPAEYPSMAIVYVDGNATFNSDRKLRGGGVLFVDGNLTVASNSNMLFSGIIYVTGNATVNGPALISGTLAVEGNVTFHGSGDVAEIDYDDGILNSVRQQVVQYREDKATRRNFTTMR